mmetsp:Transcript_5564/g.12841  ORF Transcript_5564/g.12841 Transcript_5564/m.12841 type:complete len:202 (-) Transcript_5564:685-1290(-)
MGLKVGPEVHHVRCRLPPIQRASQPPHAGLLVRIRHLHRTLGPLARRFVLRQLERRLKYRAIIDEDTKVAALSREWRSNAWNIWHDATSRLNPPRSLGHVPEQRRCERIAELEAGRIWMLRRAPQVGDGHQWREAHEQEVVHKLWPLGILLPFFYFRHTAGEHLVAHERLFGQLLTAREGRSLRRRQLQQPARAHERHVSA